jgi:hypothetical protein
LKENDGGRGRKTPINTPILQERIQHTPDSGELESRLTRNTTRIMSTRKPFW